MKFKLPFDIPSSDLQLDANSRILFLGSCFADNISQKMEYLQLRVLNNPFGTTFHPLPIATQLQASIYEQKDVSVLRRKDVYLDWSSSSKWSASSEEELVQKIIDQRKATRSFLSEADVLVVSFGTAWGYSHPEHLDIVANCHKKPNTEFRKELTELDLMFERWNTLLKELDKTYPSLRVVFTVSPVRHAKDGLVENNRSKARLIELIHRLCESSSAQYFPAYEILIDELRDYRFYAEDLVHPNSAGIAYVFDAFVDFAYTEKGKSQLAEIKSFVNFKEHRVLHDFSEEEKKRQVKLKSLQQEIATKYPWIK
ncbi:MAG: GSCFA domain-containing protein [Crocinitomicaceae bacterium]